MQRLPVDNETLPNLRLDLIEGESLTGYAEFKKLRAGKYRLIYTLRGEVLLIAIIEKRETVYATFKHLFKKSSVFDSPQTKKAGFHQPFAFIKCHSQQILLTHRAKC
jgi:hypothetical protein